MEDQLQPNEVEVPVRTATPQPAGVPEGTVLDVNHVITDTEGNVVGQGHTEPTTKELVVHDYASDGRVIGWHKEVVNG